MRSPIALIAASALVSTLALSAGCSQGTTEDSPPPADAPPAVLGGIDLNQPLRAIGTEPFWGLDVTPQALGWSGVDQIVQTAANPGPEVQGTTATWRTETDKGALLVLTLIATECSDGMSDRTYPLTARVELGEQTFSGCAATTAFLETAPKP